MHKIEIRNKNNIAIYIDHRELINNTYNNDNGTEEEKFALRTELFHFHERSKDVVSADSNGQSESANSTTTERQLKKNKRKLKTDTIITELQDLKELTNDILQLLKAQQLLKGLERRSDSILPRFWEEISTEDFPSFNGINTTTSYKHCHFGKHSYLIPPHCQFFNCDVTELPKLLPQLMPTAKQFDLIILDPPWRNKYIRRLKRVRQELSYQMLSTEQLSRIPIKQLVHERSIVAIWCTNSRELQRVLVEELLPAWNLHLKHTLHWVKVNTSGNLIGPIDVSGRKKQPFEMLYIACHLQSTPDFCARLQEVNVILSVPSVVHSHKPPLLPWLNEVLPSEPKCLEIFARYLQPQFASVGLEVLKLMDERLYSSCSNSIK